MDSLLTAVIAELLVVVTGVSIALVIDGRIGSGFAREFALGVAITFDLSGIVHSSCNPQSFGSTVPPPYQLSVSKGGNRSSPLQHSLGHIPPCPACEQAREDLMQGSLSPEMPFAEASRAWLESRNFANGKVRARYISKGTIIAYTEYLKPLTRHFGKMQLGDIHIGHIRSFQVDRATGQLGPDYEEVFARVCRWMKTSVVQAYDNPLLCQLIDQRVGKITHSEVGPNKVNQELSVLVAIMKRAGAWSSELDQFYEPLQHEETDIPTALTPQEQQLWLDTAASDPKFEIVYLYSLIAFRTTCSNVEMRHLRIGDCNVNSKLITVQAATAKNRFRIRSVTLPDDAAWALERLLIRAKEMGACGPQHYLFPFQPCRGISDPDKPMSSSGLKKPWDELRSITGLKHFSIKNTRHTAITRLAEHGVPIPAIMQKAGHVSLKMMQHYTQISEQAQRWADQAVTNGTFYPRQIAPQKAVVMQKRKIFVKAQNNA